MMASAAAVEALKQSDTAPDQIGCVVVATGTRLLQGPSLASQIAFTVGASNAAAFDISAACAGFAHGIALASDMVKAGTANHILVIGAERLTDIVDKDDPSTAFLFADGAGAAVISASDKERIGPVAWGSDGSRSSAISMTGCWDPALQSDPSLPWPRLAMVGWKVYRWATTELASVARQAIERAGMTVSDIDAFIPHQANRLITEELVRQLQFRNDTVIAHDIINTGNTSSASIPLALDRLLTEGELTSGMRALTIGFGSGLVYAGQVIEIP